MDPLTHLLSGPHAQRAFALRVVMDPPWSIDVQDRAPLTLIAMLSGEAALVTERMRVSLKRGDVAIVRGPAPYRLADEPERDGLVVIHPGQICTTRDGEHVSISMAQGVRTWGNSPTGATTMLVGTYASDAQIGAVVAAALPVVAVIPAGQVDEALLRLLRDEIAVDAPGQGGAVDRLLDVVLVHALRGWAREHPESASGWLASGRDPLVSDALKLLHEAPGAPWTIEALAQRLTVSRATLAHRFRAAVGEPPMAYLTNWRMLLAGELLSHPHRTTADIAHQVGYGSPFALSTAFKRHHGVSPSEYRRGLQTPPATEAG
ncbi:AraC family transcriptional regulator [Cryobacterium frigoriphilum]|uniref:AraC family transcriptional regulator n=1 Tax=Cryobacterium frigoriphilum TaxID=1259150 RepID=A0A4R8ZUM4_9MICO|nr:AraC family transcriptional regulator [Cryobacterium frigoriphilum]TFD46548.1 AraC family transcriptional regulator [Cryobacterium frigoriphilum]